MKVIYYYLLPDNIGEWIPIFKAGKVANRVNVEGELFENTKEDLEKIYQNFKNNVLKNREIPVVESHWGSEKAYGWVKDLKVEEDVLYALIEWNEEGKKIIADKSYRYLSPEIFQYYIDEDGKKYEKVLIRIALTNTPALNLPPLDANSLLLYAYSFVSNDNSQVGAEVFEVKDPNSLTEEEIFEATSNREKLREEAEKRSKKYGIHIRDDGHLTPPSKYVEEGAREEEDYADPVNWRYPLHTLDNALAAFKYFSKEKNQNFYKPEERLIIWERIIKALIKYKFKPTYNPEYHKDLPENLKKKMEGYEVEKDFMLIKEEYDIKINELNSKLAEITEKYNALLKDKQEMEWNKKIETLLENGNILPSMIEELKKVSEEAREEIYSLLSKQKIIDYNKKEVFNNVKIKEDEEINKIIERIERKRGGK